MEAVAMSAAGSIFTRIIRREIPAHVVYEDDAVIAFLDINPLAEGHTLVVPKRETERIDALGAVDLAAVGRALGVVAGKVVAAIGCEGYNILQNNGPVSGQEVPHVHFHIIPRAAGDGLGYRWNPQKVTPESLAALANRIRQAD
ncbi:MAG: HIT family protein [Phycisphaerales bacterium]|nr:HIT family protein [Phycisphaerales bacterium]